MDYSKSKDNEIVEITIKQDKEAYRWLVERYQNRLYSYIFRLTNHREEAADILQEVFLKAFKNLKSFDLKKASRGGGTASLRQGFGRRGVPPKQGGFSSWIYRIAHNEAVNWLKKNTRFKQQSIDDDENKIDIADQNDFVAQIDTENETQKLMKVIDKLPIKYKEVLILRFIEEKSYKEISVILRKSNNAVGILINRAKKKLAELYE